MSNQSKLSFSPDLTNADFGISVEDLLELDILPDVELIGGRGGVNRVIRAVAVMEAPDFLDWVKKDEFLLTTAFAIAPGDYTGFGGKGTGRAGYKTGTVYRQHSG